MQPELITTDDRRQTRQWFVTKMAEMACRDDDFLDEVYSLLSYLMVSASSRTGDEKEKVRKFVRMAMNEGFGSPTKAYSDLFMRVTFDLGSFTVFTMAVARESVCNMHVVGEEEVEVPDYDNIPRKTITKKKVEWDCQPILEDIG